MMLLMILVVSIVIFHALMWTGEFTGRLTIYYSYLSWLVSLMPWPSAAGRTCGDLADKGEDYVDENGVRTTVEYVINEDGKKVKVRMDKLCSASRC